MGVSSAKVGLQANDGAWAVQQQWRIVPFCESRTRACCKRSTGNTHSPICSWHICCGKISVTKRTWLTSFLIRAKSDSHESFYCWPILEMKAPLNREFQNSTRKSRPK